jgi:hypothetical protein
MKNSYLIILAVACALIGCASDNFGSRHDVKHYDVLSGDITEGFSRIRATVSESANTLPTYPTSAELRTRLGRKLIVTWNKGLPPISSLDPAKIYTLDLIVAKGEKTRFTGASVFRITDGDDIIADQSRCSMHQRAMQREVEDWIDGFTLASKGKVRQYPNSGIFHAVCNSGMHHVVWVCPECREAEQRQIDSLIGRKQPYIP